jgi:hypothetical protein
MDTSQKYQVVIKGVVVSPKFTSYQLAEQYLLQSVPLHEQSLAEIKTVLSSGAELLLG